MQRFLPAMALAAAILAVPGIARAADPALSEAGGLGGLAMWLNTGAPGMVLVLVRGGDTLVAGFGETAPGSKQEPDGKSLLRIGSITKVFAGEVLADLATDGRVSLADPLQRFAPAGFTVPTDGARPITLLDLATHSAGLPREIGDVPPDTAARAWPTQQQRWDFLAHTTLLWPPGSAAAYSNVGFMLLADALAKAAGEDYAALLHDRITGPLGMADTGVTPNADQCARLMTGTGIGGASPCVATAATEGSGGLYSTGDDMAKWLHHLIAADDAAGAPALMVARAVYRPRQATAAAVGFDEAGPMAGLGLGWVTMAPDGNRPLIVEKSGGAGGFMSYVAFVPGRHVGVFVCANRTDFGMFGAMTAAANGMLESLAPR